MLWVAPADATADSYATLLAVLPTTAFSYPLAHTQRRERLRKALGINPNQVELCLFDKKRELITKHGVFLLEKASKIQDTTNGVKRSLEEQQKSSAKRGVERVRLQSEEAKLVPLKATIDVASEALGELEPVEVDALMDFCVDPVATVAAQTALTEATQALEEAREALRRLPPELLDSVCAQSENRPADSLKAAVEAVAVILGQKADFKACQLKLLRSGPAFLRRLLKFDSDMLPASAEGRLRAFQAAPQPPASHAVAAALHAWVLAVLAHRRASDDLAASVESHSASPALLAAVQCVATLCGLPFESEALLRSELMMTATFPSPATLLQPSQGTADDSPVIDKIDLLIDASAEHGDALELVLTEIETLSKTLTLKKSATTQCLKTLSYYITIEAYTKQLESDVVAALKLKAQRKLLVILFAVLEPGIVEEDPAEAAATRWRVQNGGIRRLFDSATRVTREVEHCETKLSAAEWGSIASTLESMRQVLRRQSGSILWRAVGNWLEAVVAQQQTILDRCFKEEQTRSLEGQQAATSSALDAALVEEQEAHPTLTTAQLSAIRLLCKRARTDGIAFTRDQAAWALERADSADSAFELVRVQPMAQRTPPGLDPTAARDHGAALHAHDVSQC